ncbi:hypothetical protein L917_07968, partial [Phytophthora nicotianae]
RIVSQQLAIPSLGWKSELTKSRSPRRRVRISSPRSRRFNKERDALAVQRDELLGQLGERFMEITDLRAERDQAQEKLFNIASLLPSAPGHKRARYESESPIPSARGSKAARLTSSSSPASVSSRVPAFGSSIEVLSAVAAGRTAERSASSHSSAGPPGHLPGSVRSATKIGGRGASSSPAAPEADVHSDGDKSSSGESGSTHVFDSDTAGSDGGTPRSSGAKNEFGMPSGPLSNAKLAALQPTTVPRSWLIPLRDPVPPLEDWRDDLVDESNVHDLIESAPWEILAAPLDPLTFKSRGWFRHMKRLYASYEAEHLRDYWDSTHAFPVSIAKRRASRYLDAFYTDRKQRRSRAGARWKSFLQQVLIGLLRGYCDLDLLKDPFFLHFPRPGEAGAWYPGIEYGADPADLLGEAGAWYPGIEYGADPADLLEALTTTDAADRWRNHYHDVPEEHPALEIARLRGKFLSSSF